MATVTPTRGYGEIRGCMMIGRRTKEMGKMEYVCYLSEQAARQLVHRYQVQSLIQLLEFGCRSLGVVVSKTKGSERGFGRPTKKSWITPSLF